MYVCVRMCVRLQVRAGKGPWQIAVCMCVCACVQGTAWEGPGRPCVYVCVCMCRAQPLANRVCTCVCASAGHSLGGALANLCAFDIAAAIKESGATAEGGRSIEVSCYTYGAPRAGNAAFRAEYNALVPDSWAVINDQVPPLAMMGVGVAGGAASIF